MYLQSLFHVMHCIGITDGCWTASHSTNCGCSWRRPTKQAFSAAARQLNRAQSAISQGIANLEAALGVQLFDRSERLPKLTLEGSALLATARGIVRDADALKTQARNMAGGLEPELSIVVDVMFPQEILTETVRAFSLQFPATPLRVYVEALGAVAEAVLDRRCSVAIIGTLPTVPANLAKEWLFGVPIVTVVAPSHPLAELSGLISARAAKRHRQIVLSDRSALTTGLDFGVLGDQSWRIADLPTKQAFLRAGLGWGHMPLPAVADDIARKRLVIISIEGEPGATMMPMSAVYRDDEPPGQAGRWLIDRLKCQKAGEL